MKRRFSLLAGLLVLLGGWNLIRAEEPVPQNILVIGWDGAQYDHVMECLEKGQLPTLKTLAEEGKLVRINVEGTTDTKAGWSQILTGYYPEITGVYSNGQYQSIPEGYSVPERLEKFFGDDQIATFAVIGKSGHVDATPAQKIELPAGGGQADKKKAPRADRPKRQAGQPAQPPAGRPKAQKAKKPEGKIVVENGIRYRVIPGKPHYHMSQNIDFFKNGLMLDEKVGTLAIEKLEEFKGMRKFAFIHFAQVDHSGHQHGENSQEYTDALISNDLWTGKIIEKLKELGEYENTLIYVCVDHGFDEGQRQHKNAPYVFVGTNDKGLVRDGLRQDIAPTVLKRFGLDLSTIEPALDGVPLTEPCERKDVVLGPASPHARPAGATAPQP